MFISIDSIIILYSKLKMKWSILMVKIMIYYQGKESKKIHTLVMKKYLISLSDFYDILTITIYL